MCNAMNQSLDMINTFSVGLQLSAKDKPGFVDNNKT